MNKKILKNLIAIICIFFIISLPSNTYAKPPDNPSEGVGGSSSSISSAFTGKLGTVSNEDVSPIINILSAVLFVIRSAGVVIATVILIVIACKYMIASAGDRADIKKYAVSYIIGAVVLFATSGIAGLLQTIITEAFNT